VGLCPPDEACACGRVVCVGGPRLRISCHTRPKLTRSSTSLRGKMSYAADTYASAPLIQMSSSAAERVELKQPEEGWHAGRSDHSTAARVPLRCLRPARARRPYLRLAFAATRAPPVQMLWRRQVRESATIHRLRRMPLAPSLALRDLISDANVRMPGSRFGHRILRSATGLNRMPGRICCLRWCPRYGSRRVPPEAAQRQSNA
jgi:hypothetical protein